MEIILMTQHFHCEAASHNDINQRISADGTFECYSIMTIVLISK